MEIRAKERADKREILKQQQDEKKKRLEEEKLELARAQEEQVKHKIQQEKEQRLQAKLEEQRKKEALAQLNEIIAAKLNAAAHYYHQQLMIKYIILPLGDLIAQSKRK